MVGGLIVVQTGSSFACFCRDKMPHFGLTANKKAQSRSDLAIRTRKSVLARYLLRKSNKTSTWNGGFREGAIWLACSLHSALLDVTQKSLEGGAILGRGGQGGFFVAIAIDFQEVFGGSSGVVNLLAEFKR